LQLVSPWPEPQRWLPSEKAEQTSPLVQSVSLVQRSHSCPLEPHEPIGSASRTSSIQGSKRLIKEFPPQPDERF
jgi:hypothetical protein